LPPPPSMEPAANRTEADAFHASLQACLENVLVPDGNSKQCIPGRVPTSEVAQNLLADATNVLLSYWLKVLSSQWLAPASDRDVFGLAFCTVSLLMA